MKFFNIFSLLSSISLLAAGQDKGAAQDKYESINHYSFHIPQKWELIPGKLVGDKLKNDDLQNYSYEVALQLTKNNQSNDIKYPYVLVQFHPAMADMNTISFGTIFQQTSSGLKNEILNYSSPEVDSNKVRLISFSAPLADSSNGSVSQELIIKVRNKEVVRYIKKIFFGRFGVVNVNCFLPNDKFYDEKQDLDLLFRSLAFNDQYKLMPASPKNGNRPNKWIWLKLIIAFGVSFIVFFLVKYWQPTKRKATL